MPYIEIKAYPKDEEIKKDVASDILEVFAKKSGCAKEAITISFTEVDPANWAKDVEENIIVRELVMDREAWCPWGHRELDMTA